MGQPLQYDVTPGAYSVPPVAVLSRSSEPLPQDSPASKASRAASLRGLDTAV